MTLVLRGTDGIVFPDTSLQPVAASAALITPPFNCGRFVFADGSNCKFVPYNGDKIRVDGAIYNIPPNGVMFPCTNVNVGGTLGQNLVQSNVYLAGIYANAGVLMPFWAPLAWGHSPSVNAGNIGTEVITGTSATLVGLVYTDGAAHFHDEASLRWVLSWFNRRNLASVGATVTTQFANTNIIVITPNASLCNWGDEGIFGFGQGIVQNDSPQNWTLCYLGLDGSIALPGSPSGGAGSVWGAWNYQAMCVAGTMSPAEGAHSIQVIGHVSAGTGGVVNMSATAMTRG